MGKLIDKAGVNQAVVDASGNIRVRLGGSTVDPQVASLTDATANNLNVVYVGSENVIYNGATWDRHRSAAGASATTGTGVAATAGMLFDGTNYQVPRGGASLGDAVNNAGMIPSCNFVYNGSTWDRARTLVGDAQAATGIQVAGHALLNGTGTYDRARTVTGNTGAATTGVAMVSNYEGFLSSLNISAATAVKAAAGRLFKVSVIAAGVAGTINDCTTTGAAAAANQIGVIPAAVGVYEFNWPMLAGIVIVPGAGQTVSVVYQ